MPMGLPPNGQSSSVTDNQSSTNAIDSAETVVDARHLLRRPRRQVVVTRRGREARLFSMRQHLVHQASIEIEALDEWRVQFGGDACHEIKRKIRAILDREFGSYRVTHYRSQFGVRQASEEKLISGLLRAQFYTRLIQLPNVNRSGEPVEDCEVSLMWGIGDSADAAERARRRRSRGRRTHR